jgi:hypothetical protein
MVDIIDRTDAATVAIARGEFASTPGRWSVLARELPVLPLAILVPFVLIALFADWIAPYDPTEPIPGAKIFEPPFWMEGGSVHALLGTDFQSRDVLSRLIFGARVSLIFSRRDYMISQHHPDEDDASTTPNLYLSLDNPGFGKIQINRRSAQSTDRAGLDKVCLDVASTGQHRLIG